jgi:hypothetical protein
MVAIPEATNGFDGTLVLTAVRPWTCGVLLWQCLVLLREGMAQPGINKTWEAAGCGRSLIWSMS